MASDMAPDTPAPALEGVGDAIAVASGKGGVGKSTLAVNLSVALGILGRSVGLLDADVYGPNVPIMLGAKGDVATLDGRIEPLTAHGIRLMSLGFMLEEGTPVIWRGPMIAGALKQLVNDVAWGKLDYLMLDLPPGTGDASLSLAQMLPLSGAVIVSTPQEVALQDVRRSIGMFERLSVPILGIVENMSYYIHPGSGERIEIFGHGGARKAADELGITFLGEIPLDPAIRESGDNGTPVSSMGGTPLAEAFADIAKKLEAVVGVKSDEPDDDLPML